MGPKDLLHPTDVDVKSFGRLFVRLEVDSAELNEEGNCGTQFRGGVLVTIAKVVVHPLRHVLGIRGISYKQPVLASKLFPHWPQVHFMLVARGHSAGR